MKLYDVPRETFIRILDDVNQEVIFFDHLDGMYSFCKNAQGEIVHIFAGAEVEIVGVE
jgi:hypothetical protein